MKNHYSKKYIINTGIGLQDVDRLKNSSYFKQESERYINGEISLDELDEIITSYYQTRPDVEERTEEADKIAVRIGKLISEDAFSFTVGQYMSIHSFLFKDIIKNAGKLRTYNFTKEEWILNEASVTYGDFRELEATLQYDFSIENRFNYANMSMDEIIDHLAVFIANLWQIHAFEEGNTRTTAVFVIKYLRSLGFNISNDIFAENAWYFRNSLVRANYVNLSIGITEDRSFLIAFLRNLILNEQNELKNRDLHICNKRENKFLSYEDRILKEMKDNPQITLEKLASILNVSLRTTKSIVKNLQSDGKIVRVNGKRYGSWKVNLIS